MSVTLVEVGMRDGLQNEETILPVEVKLQIVEKLIQAGVLHIEVTSFVHPKWVPQLADAEELLSRIPENKKGTYRALVPNQRGLERALDYPVDEIAVFMSASEMHNWKNMNRTIGETLDELRGVISQARDAGKKVRGYISMVFGCPYEGRVALSQVAMICEKLFNMGVYEVSLGDTIGVATPNDVKNVLNQLKTQFPISQLAGHFHDTRGMGVANALSALECGVITLDSSFGGLGGCPYAPGASGNVATEDLVYLLHGMGVQTGINLEVLCEASQMVEEYLERELPSKVFRSVFSSWQGECLKR